MVGIEKRRVNACAFDLGNTLINDTQLAGDAIGDVADWLLDISAIESRQPFLSTYARINHDTNRPFIITDRTILHFYQVVKVPVIGRMVAE